MPPGSTALATTARHAWHVGAMTSGGGDRMSTPPDCEECGDTLSPENKNTAGHYRAKCWRCICEASHGPGRREEPP